MKVVMNVADGVHGTRNSKRLSAPESIAVLDDFLPPAPVTDALAAFEAAVGGRAALRAALDANPTLKPYEQRLVQSLARKDLVNTPLVALCVEADCTIGQLFAAHKQGQLAKAHVQAVHDIVAKVPEIIEDLLVKSTSTTQVCTACEGTGEVTGVDCSACKGAGSLLAPASLDHQKVVLGLLGWLQKGGGAVNVNTNVQTNVAVSATGGRVGGTLDRLQEAVSGLLRQPIDLPPEDPPDAPRDPVHG